ncbi:MAG: hypothetical protein ACR2GL_00595 [Thermoleophilaceae bacterium]
MSTPAPGGRPADGSNGALPADEADGGSSRTCGETAHGALRGAIAAMAMTGLRSFTVSVGLVDESPPRAILRQKSKRLARLVPKRYARAGQELAHWGYGAAGGAAFALLPERLRLQPWSGPLYGLVVWAGFELGVAPALGLSQSKQARPVDRVSLAADHLLYGLVLSETRSRPRG